MEAPTTSVTSVATLIAPKRAVMIDDQARAITPIADRDSESLAHPSTTAATKRGAGRQKKFLPVARRSSEYASVTCSTCRITYLPSAVAAAPALPQGRVCDNCQQTLG